MEFVAEAIAAISQRRLLAPASLLLVVLTATNIVILFNLPRPGTLPSLPFMAAALLRLGGLLYLSSAILRLAAPSDRPAWRIDRAFWLYVAGAVASFAIAAGIGILLGRNSDPLGLAIRNLISTIALAPFATWLVGMNVAVPLGLQPRRFMRDFGAWLPHLILWSLLLVTPLGILHAFIGTRLIAGVGDLFWPLALFDGALSVSIALAGFGLNIAAYRRVARD